MGWFSVTFSPRNTSRGSKHDNKLQGARSQARFVTQILPGHRLSQVVTEVHLYLIKFNNLSFKMMKSINLSALTLVSPLAKSLPDLTAYFLVMLKGQQFQYLHWVLGLHTVSTPTALACCCPFPQSWGSHRVQAQMNTESICQDTREAQRSAL